MKLNELGEFGFIERISPDHIPRPSHVVRGIGDDCAVIRTGDPDLYLITTDLLIEGIHFTRKTIDPRRLGRKSISVNLSDIAAMGGVPRDAFVAIAVPENLDVEFLDAFYEGIHERTQEFQVNILGGDTTSSLRDFMISITLTGTCPDSQVIFRNTARPGDHIFLTGPVGDSAAGLDILLNRPEYDLTGRNSLIHSHLDPYPHIEQGRWIAQSGCAHAMIDVSDGVSADLGHICDESSVGCTINSHALPLSDGLREYCLALKKDPLDFALSGGEDYVLLCTGDPALLNSAHSSDMELFDIGIIEESRERFIRNSHGMKYPFQSRGWDHFSGSP